MKGMVENRVNNTEPVVQARLRVIQGNLYGVREDPPNGGFYVFKNTLGLNKDLTLGG